MIIRVCLIISLFALGCGDRSTPPLTATDAVTHTDVMIPSTDTSAQVPDTVDPGCTPSKTCADYIGSCASKLPDGCVGEIDCSNACLPPQVCGIDEKCGDPPDCTPACDGKVCGDDGCDGTCGDCAAGEACEDGQCVGCTPACDGKVCGDDGCEGTCGGCQAGETCSDWQCAACTPACDGKVCGDDGCEGACGDCAAGEACTDGQCAACTPACDGKVCGDDGCEGTCGDCQAGETCADGACTPQTGDTVQLTINEVLADPAADSVEGDANCDDERSDDDEFVEIVNVGTTTADLSGATLSDDKSVKHTFSAGTTLAAGGAIVVFSGGDPFKAGAANASAWCNALPDAVQVVTASSGSLDLNNTGDTITLASADAAELTSTTYGGDGGKDQSLVRSPELTGAFVLHGGVAGAIGPQSPGVAANGAAL